MKRRKFFKVTSAGAAGFSLAASCRNITGKGDSRTGNTAEKPEVPPYRAAVKSNFATDRARSAADKVILALIGAGGWGSHVIIETAGLNENVFVKYICDVDDTRGGRAIEEVERIQGARPVRVRDMRRIFDDREVDAVIIATPEHWHGLATIRACQAGKDVYVEKCISHSIIEGQKMVEAAMKYERIVQCGTLNRSARYGLTARDYIRSGELGDVVTVNAMELTDGPVPFVEKEDTGAPSTIDWDLWLGPAPKVPYNVSRNKSWAYYWDYAGGYAFGQGVIHQADMLRMALDDPGFPKSVYCTGGRYLFNDERDVPDYQLAVFDYGNFVMTLQGGEFTPYLAKTNEKIRFGNTWPEWQQNATRIEIYGTRRMMYLGVMGGGWQVFDKDMQLVASDKDIYPLKDHIRNFLSCVRSRKQPNGNILQGHYSASLIHMANLSYRSGCRQLLFSPDYETILNDETARELGRPKYRKGFELPDIV
ncbi:MAG TPA: Gfo/Idh/MocA family oxidoreductase [Bacteroidales bacterium]|nr:Gfo/Idh/MocA family oxidoreductase [Bacteroidales bacterium]HNR41343.1 Gfo/Idh/MocA family oxidoreductase [Bacteroidales bacterium]HPM18237.1 Gfo/Idh/MocA family oxidoreductase [Bacteroidales bacterium]